MHSVSLKECIFLTGTGKLEGKRIHCFLKGWGHICRIIWLGTSTETRKIGREGFVQPWRVNLLGSHPPHWRGGGTGDACSNSCFVLMCFLVGLPGDTLTLGPSASSAQKASLCHCGPDVTLTFLFLFARSWIEAHIFAFIYLFFPLVIFIEQGQGGWAGAWLHINIRNKHLHWIFSVSENFSGCVNQCCLLFCALLALPQILGTGKF